MQLLSSQQFACQSGGLQNNFNVDNKQSTLMFGGYTRLIPYHQRNCLPIFSSNQGCTNFTAYQISLVADGSLCDNLTSPQWQLLKWHCCLGHLRYHKIQQIYCMGLLPKKLSTSWQGNFPICPACPSSLSLNTYSISAATTYPGYYISMNLIHSPIWGLIPQHDDKPRTERYKYKCIFFDHATRLTQ